MCEELVRDLNRCAFVCQSLVASSNVGVSYASLADRYRQRHTPTNNGGAQHTRWSARSGPRPEPFRFRVSTIAVLCVNRCGFVSRRRSCVSITGPRPESLRFRVSIAGPVLHRWGFVCHRDRDFLIDNLLIRIHLIVEMILVDRPCAMEV